MAFWTALLLGALGGMATVFALRAARANSLALPNEDGPSRQAGQEHGRRSSARVLSGDRGTTRLEIREKRQEGGTTADAVLPRILTVLTTYYKRSPLIKEYKEAVADRDDGYEPTVSLSVRAAVWVSERVDFIRTRVRRCIMPRETFQGCLSLIVFAFFLKRGGVCSIVLVHVLLTHGRLIRKRTSSGSWQIIFCVSFSCGKVFVVSNLDDEDPYDVIDFKVGSPTHHRSIAAIAEVRAADTAVVFNVACMHACIPVPLTT